MTVRILRRIYREQKVKMKRIKFVKQWTPRQPERKEQVFTERARRLDHMIQHNYDVIYVDEVMFTKHTCELMTWSTRNQNVEVDQRYMNMKPLACCVAVSERYGLDLLMIWPHSINRSRF